MTSWSSPERGPGTVRVVHPPKGPEDLRRVLGDMEAGLAARACVVGGAVRDLLLGRPATPEVDLVVEGCTALEAGNWLRERWRGRARVVEFERFGTARVNFASAGELPLTVELVRARSEAYQPSSRKPDVSPGTIEEDAGRRDFTINALLIDSRGAVLDPTGRGLADLAGRVLRTPLEPQATFAEDPLRMLRAARFVAQLDFGLAPGLEAAMRQAAPRLAIVSQERIREELVKLLLAPRAGLGLELLERTGLLSQFAPELSDMRGVEQGGYHLGDVLSHTCLALELAPPERLVRLGVLLHDAGKPPTASASPSGPTFHGHPRAGAEIARNLMRRLRFSTAETEAVTKLVLLHMRPIQYRSEWTDSAVRRLWHDAGELLPTLLEVARADTRASTFPEDGLLDELRRRAAGVAAEHPGGLHPPVDGEQLLAHFQLPRGPWVGRAQRLLLEAVLEGLLPREGDPRLKEDGLSLLEAHRAEWEPRLGEAGSTRS
ncbi:MAG: CCA tRNA nucleotidyltransferase [Candidatus Dormibacteria bacterium]